MAYISRTQTAGNQKTFTLSFWVKRANVTDEQTFFSVSNGGSYMQMKLNLNEYLEYNDGPSTIRFITSRMFRDPSAWYHLVFAIDTTQGTAADRVKIYVNGSQLTDFHSAVYPSQNADIMFFNQAPVHLGREGSGSAYVDGYMAEVNYIDGTALAPASFGATDVLTGQWNPKKYGGGYGTNGFI